VVTFPGLTKYVPNVSHTVEEAQETDVNTGALAPTGKVMPFVAANHAVPFHIITTGPALLSVAPTVTQKLDPTQDTERKDVPRSPPTSGLFTVVHDVPFHDSVRAPPPAPLLCPPTLTHEMALVQETEFRKLLPAPAAALASVHVDALTGA